MSDWHFGGDYDMWLYPPVDWTPDCDYELPEPIEAANIEGTLLINAKDAIEQMRRLQAENAKLQELLAIASDMARDYDGDRRLLRKLVGELMPTARIAAQHGINVGKLADQERRARKLGVEVDDG